MNASHFSRRQWLQRTGAISIAAALSACGKSPENNAPAAAAAKPDKPSDGQKTVAVSGTDDRTVTVKEEWKIGITPNRAPAAFRDVEGKWQGWEIEIIEALFAALGKNYSLVSMVWTDKEKMLLEEKSIDCIISCLTITPQRKTMFAFSESYFDDDYAVLVRKDSKITDHNGLAGQTVGTVSGFSVIGSLKAFRSPDGQSITVREYVDERTGILGLMSDEVVAMVGDGQSIRYAAQHNAEQLRVLPQGFDRQQYAVALRPNDLDRLKEINTALFKLRDNGTLNAVRNKWFGA